MQNVSSLDHAFLTERRCRSPKRCMMLRSRNNIDHPLHRETMHERQQSSQSPHASNIDYRENEVGTPENNTLWRVHPLCRDSMKIRHRRGPTERRANGLDKGTNGYSSSSWFWVHRLYLAHPVKIMACSFSLAHSLESISEVVYYDVAAVRGA